MSSYIQSDAVRVDGGKRQKVEEGWYETNELQIDGWMNLYMFVFYKEIIQWIKFGNYRRNREERRVVGGVVVVVVVEMDVW